MKQPTCTFKSKMGFPIPVSSIFFIGSIVSYFFFNTDISNIVVAGCFFIFAIILTVGTQYQISNDQLVIKFKFLYKKAIPINSIRELRPSNDPTSSPALSLNRLRVRYNKFDDILLSPQNQEQFIAELLARNPNIFYNPKRE